MNLIEQPRTLYKDKDGHNITPEFWQWLARLENGQEIRQFDPDTMSYHYFNELDGLTVVQFGLINIFGKDIIKDLPDSAIPIHFYENIISHPIGGEKISYRLFCFGYQTKEEEQIWTVLPNNFIVNANPDTIEVL